MDTIIHRGRWGALSLATLLLFGACASEEPARKRNKTLPELAAGADPRYRPGQMPIGGDESGDGIVVHNEQGVLDQRDVDQALDRHVRSLIGCYDRAGTAQQYASGEVVLKFVVAPGGSVSDVLVIDSGLGNYAVERCLVVEARRIAFPSPRGGKHAEFEYPLRFRSSGEVSVVEWEVDLVAKDVASQSSQLAACGDLAGDLRAVAYVQPGGSVASVGLASQTSIDPTVGLCVVEAIRKWKLPDDRGHMVRTAFAVEVSPAARPEPKRVASKRTRSRRSTR